MMEKPTIPKNDVDREALRYRFDRKRIEIERDII
jgi:hypothetical protein